MFMRLWGLLGMYQWGAGTLRDPPADPVVRGLILGQVAVNTCYQVLENLAYLNQHALLGFSKRTEGRMWIWSTRCWVAHITMDFIRLQRVRATRKGVVTEKEETAWRKSWLCNMTNMPLAVGLVLAVGVSCADVAVVALGHARGVAFGYEGRVVGVGVVVNWVPRCVEGGGVEGWWWNCARYRSFVEYTLKEEESLPLTQDRHSPWILTRDRQPQVLTRDDGCARLMTKPVSRGEASLKLLSEPC